MSLAKQTYPRPQDARRRKRIRTLQLALIVGLIFSALVGLGLWLINRT